MKAVSLVFLGLALLAGTSHAASGWPLVIDAPPAWRVECIRGDTLGFSLTRSEGDGASLVFSKWQASGQKAQIPAFVVQIADGFMRTLQDSEIAYVTGEGYVVEPIRGDAFSGEAALFTTTDGLVLVLFIIGDDKGLWNGQFSGPADAWDEAKTILERLQRRDE